MKPYTLFPYLTLAAMMAFYACSGNGKPATELQETPVVYPDYREVVVPANIAPLNFMMAEADDIAATFLVEGKECLQIDGTDGVLAVPADEWKGLMEKAAGKCIQVKVSAWTEAHPQGAAYQPFSIQVAKDSIDPWIAYRLIEPGYQSWRQLGLYQRDITSFEEKLIVGNHSNTNTCLNCHSFANHAPDKLMFHARGDNGGTYIWYNGKMTKVNIEKIGLKKGASYPIWHPGGKLLTFSSNTTQQAFFEHGKQPLEVYDERSDLIFYDVERGEVFSDPRFLTSESMETYPAWSPDGKWLYYVSAVAKKMPQEYKDMHYSLLRVSFNADTRTFGETIDTLYNARNGNGSVSYPRISPDGRYLLYTHTSHGTFPIWHKEADLRMMDLQEGREVDIAVVNSAEADSYHAWSSNGRWMVFGSRRTDGRYTRLYLAHWGEDGKAGKPFLLPQEDPRMDAWRMKSYNIPEFIRESVDLPSSDFLSIIR